MGDLGCTPYLSDELSDGCDYDHDHDFVNDNDDDNALPLHASVDPTQCMCTAAPRAAPWDYIAAVPASAGCVAANTGSFCSVWQCLGELDSLLGEMAFNSAEVLK